MTLTQKRLYLKLTRNSFCIFLSANDIVSYREFISGPLHVRLKQICPNRGPIDGFVRPIFSFSFSDKYPNILTTTSYFDNLQFAIFDAGSSHYHFNQGHNKGGTNPRAHCHYGDAKWLQVFAQQAIWVGHSWFKMNLLTRWPSTFKHRWINKIT